MVKIWTQKIVEIEIEMMQNKIIALPLLLIWIVLLQKVNSVEEKVIKTSYLKVKVKEKVEKEFEV